MAQNTSSPAPLSKRIVSLDVLRGFIMFSMLVGTLGLEELSHLPVIGFIYTQLTHAPWRGFHFEDVILPTFLFIIGVAMSLSAAGRRERGETPRSRFWHAVKRSLTLFLLGFILSWISAGKPYFGAGVLQVLAVSYFCAYLYFDRPVSIQWIVFGSLLFIYWFFIFTVPVPEAGRNSYVIYQNLVYYLDDIITGSATRWGYLYTLITSAAVVVYGSIIGKLLLNRSSHRELIKTLAIYGVAGVICGLAMNPFIPIIKRMFTPSYTLLTCGIVTLLFCACYWAFDVREHRRPGLPFIIFGANSIFIYMLDGLLSNWLMETGGIFINPLGVFIGAWTEPLCHVLRLAAEWFVCFWLYEKRLFFKI